MFVKVNSCGIEGIDGYMVTVEANFSGGIPQFDIVGLPDASVKESKERVRSALSNSHLSPSSKKVVINLAPADIKKVGAIYDLPILMTFLCENGKVDYKALEKSVFVGEVSLSGELAPVKGSLAMAITAMNNKMEAIYMPAQNAKEASVIEGIKVFGVKNVVQLFNHLTGVAPIEQTKNKIDFTRNSNLLGLDFAQVKGQRTVKRSALISVAGSHNMLLIGSPGSGKSMLAKRLPTIMPPMDFDEIIETTKIHSVAGLTNSRMPLVIDRPFRSPHHTVSPNAMAGGGVNPRPGEVSLSHNGVLFLDELTEFSKNTLEILRQPLEDGNITITRVSGSVCYPTRFILVCAMNPCKCGYYGHPTHECTCSKTAVSNYMARISGPLLDRIDLHVEVQPVEFDHMTSSIKDSESSAVLLEKVISARKMQRERYKSNICNSQLTTQMIEEFCPLDSDVLALLRSAFERLSLSARAYDKVIKVSRTIADLEGCERIKKEHILEAIQLRSLDRKYWG